MIKRLLPLLVGLTVGGAAIAQNAPVAPPDANAAVTQPVTRVTRWRAQQPPGALSEADIKTAIANAGYKEVKGLQFKNGVWRSKARGGNDKWTKLAVAPVSGTVYPADAPSNLNEDEVKAKLTAAGYRNINDVDFDSGLWSAEAKNAQGKDLDLLVDPKDGSVVAKSLD